MNRAIPPITETPEDLKALLKAEHHVKRAQRIQMLYLLASKQIQTRRAVALALGVHRETIGAWLELYASGGLTALLDLYTPAGKKPTVTPTIAAALHAALCTHGFSSYQEIADWLWNHHGIQLSYSAVHTLVHYKLKLPLNAPHDSKPTAHPSLHTSSQG